MEDHAWYVGAMDREAANQKLANYPYCTFLVRCRVQVNKVEVKFVRQISYPPANGMSYFLPKSNKLAVFLSKNGLEKLLWQPKLQTFFQMVFGSG